MGRSEEPAYPREAARNAETHYEYTKLLKLADDFFQDFPDRASRHSHVIASMTSGWTGNRWSREQLLPHWFPKWESWSSPRSYNLTSGISLVWRSERFISSWWCFCEACWNKRWLQPLSWRFIGWHEWFIRCQNCLYTFFSALKNTDTDVPHTEESWLSFTKQFFYSSFDH